MKTNIRITERYSQNVAAELSKILADENILYTKTKNAYWNVEGNKNYDKPEFFETQILQLNEIIDSIAKHIRSIGYYVLATLKAFLDLTQLTELSREKKDGKGFIKELLDDHESICIRLHEDIYLIANDYHDLRTSDFITILIENHRKMVLFLRSQL